jgi:hypothetical protein
MFHLQHDTYFSSIAIDVCQFVDFTEDAVSDFASQMRGANKMSPRLMGQYCGNDVVSLSHSA